LKAKRRVNYKTVASAHLLNRVLFIRTAFVNIHMHMQNINLKLQL